MDHPIFTVETRKNCSFDSHKLFPNVWESTRLWSQFDIVAKPCNHSKNTLSHKPTLWQEQLWWNEYSFLSIATSLVLISEFYLLGLITTSSVGACGYWDSSASSWHPSCVHSTLFETTGRWGSSLIYKALQYTFARSCILPHALIGHRLMCFQIGCTLF